MRYLRIYPALLLVMAGFGFCVSDYAAEVVGWYGNFYGTGLYDDPQAVLEKPATRCLNNPLFPWGQQNPDYRVKIVEAASYLSIEQQRVVTEIYPYQWITVKFDHKVLDHPNNPYGQDLIVFGNSFFNHSGQGSAGDQADMNTFYLSDPAQGWFEGVMVSVSQDGVNWCSFDPNVIDPNTAPLADSLFPTQAYHWDRANACWTDREMDFTRPVDPNLKLNDFSGLSAADAIDLYEGSGGGTSYDLRNLAEFDSLEVDPQTGCRWIQYVRLEGGTGPYATGGDVDAVSDVAACGDPTHPYPPGDINQDCRVNLLDLMILSENWLVCTWNCGQ